MSDLFISEMLALILLVPVLLRPFFYRMQKIAGIALLPLVSLLIAFAIIAVNGVRISFLPVFVFIFLVFLSGLTRLFRFFYHLSTDWYSSLSKIYSFILLILCVGVMCLAFVVSPEDAYRATRLVQRTVFIEQISSGIGLRNTIISPIEGERTNIKDPIIVLIGDISSGSGGRNTLAWILAENGFTVIDAECSSKFDYKNSIMNYPFMRKFVALVGKIFADKFFFTDENEISTVHTKELTRIIQYVHKRFGVNTQIYVIAEGTSSRPFLLQALENSNTFAGGVCVVPDIHEFLPSLQSMKTNAFILSLDDGMLPSNANGFQFMVVTGSPRFLLGFGELSADDVLASFLLGVERDVNRKNAEILSRRIVSWLSMRSKNDNP